MGRKHWPLVELFARAGVDVVGDAAIPAVNITSLTDDARELESGGCFVAIRGDTVDGHQFIEAALRGGASAVVVERDVAVPDGIARVRVVDTRSALARLASTFFGLRGNGSPFVPLPYGRVWDHTGGRDSSGTGDRSPYPLIGITGTNGKTTVAWLLRSILQAAGYRTALVGTIEYDLIRQRRPAALTTPGPIELCRLLSLARQAGASHGVLEVSSHALAQRRCDGLAFAVGVFTNLSGDHLDYHHSMERYGAAKRRLFDLLERDGVAVINREDPMGRTLMNELPGQVLTFGLDRQPESPVSCSVDRDLSASIESLDRFGSTFELRGGNFTTPVRLRLVGKHNLSNALAAAGAAVALRIAPEAIRLGLEQVASVPGRLQVVSREGCPITVFVDYAHTDAALAHALAALRTCSRQRLICVFGCGGDRDRSKRPRMASVVNRLADVAYVTSDNPRTESPQSIIEDILVGFGGAPICRVLVEADRQRAIEAAIKDAEPGDTILIAGKGHETNQQIGDKVLPFEDASVAGAFLEKVSGGGRTG